MKSVQMAVGIAAALAVASVGFEARAQGVTRAECEANALMSYNAELRRCARRSGFEAMHCRIFAESLYQSAMGYCAKIPLPGGGNAPPVKTSKPNWIDGWFGF